MNKLLKSIVSIASLLLAATIGWYFGSQHKNQPVLSKNEEIVAIINGEIISKDNFIMQMKLHGGLRAGQYQTLEQKQALLDYLINQEVIFSNAKEIGITENIAVQNFFKNKVVERYLEQALNPKLAAAKISQNDVIKYFEKNKESYTKPARRRAAIIFVQGKNQARIIEAKNKLSELGDDIKHFGELAKTYSDDRNSRYRGGVIGWLINHPARKYRWDDKVIDALFSLANDGDISPILETQEGFYLVRLVAKENLQKRTLAKVEKGIKNSLKQKLVKQIKAEFLDNLTAAADITINQQILAAIQPLTTVSKSTVKPPALPGSGGK